MGLVLAFLLAGEAWSESKVIKIGFGSCAHQDSTQEIWNAVTNWGPDLFIHLGDAIYVATRDPGIMRATYEKASKIETFRAIRGQVPFLSTWDDHDYGENDAGASYPMREASRELFFAFWGHQGDPARTSREGVYASRLVENAGRTVRVIVLDTRYFRSGWTEGTGGIRRYAPDCDSTKTILGAEQWRWLERELQKPADLRVIASSIQVVNDEHAWECWGNFPVERERLMRLIDHTSGRSVIVSGDRHFSELSCQTGRAYPLYDFTSSGLTQLASNGHKVPNGKRIGPAVTVQSFAGLQITFGETKDRLTFLAFDREGREVYTHDVALSELNPPDGARR